MPDSTSMLIDSASGATLWSAPLPFDEPVMFPDVLALADGDYLVSGIPCSEVLAEHPYGPDCSPGGVRLARFNTAGRTFQVIEAAGLDGTTPYVNLVGTTGSTIVVQVGGQVYSVPVTGGRLNALAASPFDGFTVACMDGERIVVARVNFEPEPSSSVPGSFVPLPETFVPVEAAVLDLATGAWADLGGPPVAYRSNDTFEVGCVDGGIVAVPTERPTEPDAPYVTFVLDLTTGAWSEAAAPPIEFLSAGPVAADGSDLVLLVSTDIGDTDTAVLTFDGVMHTWHETDGGDGAAATATAIGGGRLVSVTSTGGHPRVTQLR
jgi:hypothetical protein